MRAPDLIVVGGGIVGLLCAEALARAGRRVLLLERGRVGSGCTGAGGGVLSLQTKRPGPHLRLAQRSMALLAAREAELGPASGLRWCGSLTLARTPEEWAHLAARAELLRAAGVDVTLVSAHELRSLEPGLAPELCGASWCPGD